MTLALFDTHCHLDYEPLLADADNWLAQSRLAGIMNTLVPATTFARFPHICQFVSAHSGTHLALGLHPIYLDEHSDDVLDAVSTFLIDANPVAIGEVGLDYFVEHLSRERQQKVFERMIDLAMQFNLPLVLHVRRAHDAVIATLRRKRFQGGGIVHAFAGSTEHAKQFVRLGFKLGFGGVMTYSSATRIRAQAANLCLSDLVLETDAPDMKPVDWPLDFNTPLALPSVFSTLCSLRKESAEEIAQATTRNAFEVLRIAAIGS